MKSPVELIFWLDHVFLKEQDDFTNPLYILLSACYVCFHVSIFVSNIVWDGVWTEDKRIRFKACSPQLINSSATDRRPTAGCIQLSVHWASCASWWKSCSVCFKSVCFLRVTSVIFRSVHALHSVTRSNIRRFLSPSSCTRKPRSWCWQQEWLSWSLAGCLGRVRKIHPWLRSSSSGWTWRAGLTHPETLEGENKTVMNSCVW